MFNLDRYSMITNDSRKVRQDAIYAALPGVNCHGKEFIEDAIAAGAKYILVEKGIAKPDSADIHWHESKDVRHDYAMLCASFYNMQPQNIVAVTGTNGKSSVVNFVRQLLGEKAVSLGTIGLQGAGFDQSAGLTTLDPAELHRLLADCAKKGVEHCALEASSHGLEQRRLDGVNLSAAAFTNISHDHLDYHKTMESYLAAKLKIFDLLPDGAPAIINADIPEASEIVEYAAKRKRHVLTFGEKGKSLKIVSWMPTHKGIDAVIQCNGQDVSISLSLLGVFQLYNALSALLLAYPESYAEHIQKLESLSPVNGRMDKIDGHPKGAQVFVDYAHTPDALETVLKALRPHLPKGGRLVALIGCGGDRDTAKRAPMASVSGALADHVIVTDDNPRTEDPAKIRNDVLAGYPEAQEIDGRAAAIIAAVKMLNEKDILLVAGKGHEQGQIIGKDVIPFDDSEEIRKAYKEA